MIRHMAPQEKLRAAIWSASPPPPRRRRACDARAPTLSIPARRALLTSTPGVEREDGAWDRYFRAWALPTSRGRFEIRNYRLFATGNGISQIGYWIQRVAQSWLAWQLTHSGTWLGLVAAADLIPNVVISPFAGALADRVDRIKLIRLTQLVAILQAWVLAILSFSGIITVDELFGLIFALGFINAFNQPARLALIPSLVDSTSLPSAVALNSLIFNLARFIGPGHRGGGHCRQRRRPRFRPQRAVPMWHSA